jgi:hypothetical protein
LDADLAGGRRHAARSGEDLAATLGGAPPDPRKFYWRYKAGSQRAIRDADWKYLRIACGPGDAVVMFRPVAAMTNREQRP